MCLTNLSLSLVVGVGGIASLTKASYWLNENQRADAPSPVQQSALPGPSSPLHKTPFLVTHLIPSPVCTDSALRLPSFLSPICFPTTTKPHKGPGVGPSRQVDFSWDVQVVDTWPDLLSESFALLCICCAV